MGNTTSEIASEILISSVSMPSKSTLSFVSSKIWLIPSKKLDLKKKSYYATGPSLNFVVFRTNNATGQRKLIVNDELIAKSNDYLDGSGKINFTVEGNACRLEILSFPGLSSYNLYCNNELLPSIMEMQEPHNIERPKVCVREAYLVHNGIDVKPTNDEKLPLESGKSTWMDVKDSTWSVHFEIVSEYQGEIYHSKKRFADFDELDCLIRSTFKGQHLYANLPRLPNKCMKVVTNHYSRDFIETRRCDLNFYLKRLVSIPHTVPNPDLMQFLGIPLTIKNQK